MSGRCEEGQFQRLSSDYATHAVGEHAILRHTSFCHIHCVCASFFAKIRVTPKRFTIDMILYAPFTFRNGVNDVVVTLLKSLKWRSEQGQQKVTTLTPNSILFRHFNNALNVSRKM